MSPSKGNIPDDVNATPSAQLLAMFPPAPSLAAILFTLETNPDLATLLLHSVNDLCDMPLPTLSPTDLAYVSEWLQDIWTLLHRSPAVQDAFLAAEFRELHTAQDIARHTIHQLQGFAYASWGHRAPVYEETIPLLGRLVRLQQLGFLTFGGQPTECVRAEFVNGKWWERRQRGYVEGLLRGKYVPDFVAYLDTFKGKVGYDFVTADGKTYSSHNVFPANRERRLNKKQQPMSPWYEGIRPLRLWEPHGRHRRLTLEAADVASQVALIGRLNPALGQKIQDEYTAYAYIFALKACSQLDVDVLQVAIDFLEARVPKVEVVSVDRPDGADGPDPLTLYGALKTMRLSVKTAKATAPNKHPGRKMVRNGARERAAYERAFERDVRTRAKRNGTAVKLPPPW